MRRWQRIRRPWLNWHERALRRNIGVYVHIPFCLHRCSYCDFLTYGDKRPAGLTPPVYVEALHKEITRRGEWAWNTYADSGRYVDTVFFGGGTPTYLEPEVLAGLVRSVYQHFPMQQVGQDSVPVQDSVSPGGQARSPVPPEITVEANPDTLTREYLHALAQAGVNRLSIGVQATQTHHLRRMERTHRWHDIAPRLAWLPGGPIPRYSFDLIYGLPGMTATEVKQSLGRLLEFAPRHISAYELIYEPGTPLHRWLAKYPQQELPEQARLAQHKAIGRLLAGHGLYRYEISNYATPGEESRHNLRYWRGGDYIGIGIGAASRIGSEVVNNPRSLELYRSALASYGGAQDPMAAALATAHHGNGLAPPADVFLQMRTRGGIALNGHVPDAEWVARGWVRLRQGELEVTSRGLSYADLYHRTMA